MQDKPRNVMELRQVSSNDDRLIFTDLIESAFSRMADVKARSNFTNINLNAQRLWVLEIKGSLIGTLVADRLKDKDGIWLLSGLTIVPYWRKGGLASFMLTKAIAELKNNGCKILLTFLHPELKIAEHLFLDKFGFQPQHPRPSATSAQKAEDSKQTSSADNKPQNDQQSYLASLKL